MLLKEWSELSGILPTSPTEIGATSVVIDHYNEHRKQLWHLSDFTVSSVAGAVVWLVPSPRMKPGYAYVSRHPYPTEADEVETEMVVQSECDSVKSRGNQVIDGLNYRAFRSADGSLYYFQRNC